MKKIALAASSIAIAVSAFACAPHASSKASTAIAPTAVAQVASDAPAESSLQVPDERVRARADAAVTELALDLDDVERACRDHWRGDDACDEAAFARIAKDYQAYYARIHDPLENEGRIDSLARLGGEGVSVAELASRIRVSCNERCRVARAASIGRVVEDATDECSAKPTGHDACNAIRMKSAPTIEIERLVHQCTSVCDERRKEEREERAYAIERERRRPRTEAQANACRKKCDEQFGGGFCGTSILACDADCEPRKEAKK